MKIQVLGTGCAKCHTLTANTEQAVRQLSLEAEVEKVSEVAEIMQFQILMTPGLVINGRVRAAGRVPSVDEIKQMLVAAGAESCPGRV